MSHGLILTIMIFVGAMTMVQGPINSKLGKHLGHPMHAAIVSFATGLVMVAAASLFMKEGLPNWSQVAQAPKILLIGGTLGAVFVVANISFMQKVGAAKLGVASICGQMLISLLVDHYRLFDVPHNPIDIKRVAAATLVVIGVALMNWR